MVEKSLLTILAVPQQAFSLVPDSPWCPPPRPPPGLLVNDAVIPPLTLVLGWYVVCAHCPLLQSTPHLLRHNTKPYCTFCRLLELAVLLPLNDAVVRQLPLSPNHQPSSSQPQLGRRGEGGEQHDDVRLHGPGMRSVGPARE